MGGGHPGHRTAAHATRGAHAHGSLGRQVVDGQDNTWRGGAIGPHAHGNAARHVVDDLNVEGSGQQKP